MTMGILRRYPFVLVSHKAGGCFRKKFSFRGYDFRFCISSHGTVKEDLFSITTPKEKLLEQENINLRAKMGGMRAKLEALESVRRAMMPAATQDHE